uniref:glutathione transferase n=1 Tax=Culex tarsalis TaxID=7177 RepID=A0A1Q3FP86_CULTA
MAPIVLYHFPMSPPSRSALLVARNLGLDVEVKILNLFAGEHMTEDFLKINPQHTVPTLVDDDYVLWESKAIATYLVEQHKPDSPLYPSDPRKRGLVNRMLYFDSSVLFARAFAAIQPVMRQGAKSIPQERKDAVADALSTLNGFLEGNDWVAGEECSVADLCILATVSSIEKLGGDMSSLPNVTAWLERCKSLPGFDENDEGATMFGQGIGSKLEEPY